jgi:hypothetical protein
MKIPDNYSGHAFSQKAEYQDMPPPIRQSVPKDNYVKEPRFHSPPNAAERDQGGKFASHTEDFAENSEEYQAYPSLFPNEIAPPPSQSEEGNEEIEQKPKSLLLPDSSGSAGRFPFGHGIGSEELIILAMMLLVYLSEEDGGKGDYEFLFILGLLLFAG